MGDLDRAEEIVNPNAADDECSPGTGHPEVRLIETLERFVTDARVAFPDFEVTVEDLIPEEPCDRITVALAFHWFDRTRFLAEGREQGELL